MSNLFLLLLLNWLAVPPSLVWRAVLGVRQALRRLSVGLGMAREEVVGLQEEDGCGDSASIWSEGCSAPGRDQMLQVLYPCTPPLSSTSCSKRQRP